MSSAFDGQQHPEKPKPHEASKHRLQEEARHGARHERNHGANKHGADKHVHHMALVDKHGHPVDHVHRVKKGETLYGIARHERHKQHHGTTKGDIHRYSKQIAHSNDLKHPYTLHPGQELLIPKYRRHHAQTLHSKLEHKKDGKSEQHHLQHLDKRHLQSAKKQHEQQHHEPKHSQREQHRQGKHPQPEHHGPKHPGDHHTRTRSHPRREAPGRVAQRPEVQPPAAPPERQTAQPPPVSADDRAGAPRQGRYGYDGEPGPVAAQPTPASAERQPVVPPPAGPQEVQPPVAPITDRTREGEGNVERSGSLAGKIIVIDPGHGDQDSGEVAGGIAEKNVTPLYAAALAQKLEALGAKVYLTRPLQDDPNMPG